MKQGSFEAELISLTGVSPRSKRLEIDGSAQHRAL